MTDEHELGKW